MYERIRCSKKLLIGMHSFILWNSQFQSLRLYLNLCSMIHVYAYTDSKHSATPMSIESKYYNAFELLTSKEGLEHRSKRPIEPEAVFGQTKFDMGYKRFRHFGIDKIYMDFGIFAISANLKKLLQIKRYEM